MRALLTGATGMLGSHLVERLLAAGVEVRALVRPTGDTRILQKLPIDILRGDAADPDTAAGVVEGCQWVFHVAAHFSVGSVFGDRRDVFQVRSSIVDTTKALLKASQAAGVGRFVYTSSASVYDPDACAPISENARLEPNTEYGRSKVMAETLVRAYQSRGVATTIIRPCIMYGPRDRHFCPVALRLSRSPILPLVDGGRHLTDLVYVADAVELIWQASQAEVAAGQIYNSASGAPLSVRQLVEDFRQVTGHAPRILAVSTRTARLFARLGCWYLGKFAPSVEGLVSPVSIAHLSHDVYYDIARAKKDLNYAPRFDFKRGLELTLADHQGLTEPSSIPA